MLGPNLNSAVQLVILKNGEMFRGRVSRKSDQVIVETIQGSRIVLFADQTDFVCNSLEEAYWGKCARTRATDIAGQKKLFQWCLKYKLLEQAQNQIDILSEIEIKATELEYLDRQLNVAIMQKHSERLRLANESRSKQAAKHSNGTTTASSNSSNSPAETPFAMVPIEVDQTIGLVDLGSAQVDTTVFRPLPALSAGGSEVAASIGQRPQAGHADSDWQSQPTIQQVGYTEAVNMGADSMNADSDAYDGIPTPSSEPDDRIMTPIFELEREMDELPQGTVGTYRQSVERALTVGCSAAKCHDSNSRIMPLLHRGVSQTVPRRQSQRNLHNVLKYVDRQSPFESRLLIAATSPHAGMAEPVIVRGTGNYEHLAKWLISLSDDPANAMYQEPPIDEQTETDPTNATNEIQPIKPDPATLLPLGDSPVQIPKTIGEIPEFDSQQNRFRPLDPFDPEIFNRKYGGK